MVCSQGGPQSACWGAGKRFMRQSNSSFRFPNAITPSRLCRYCELNTGKLNSCAMPQELSDAEIDENNTPAVSGAESCCGPKQCFMMCLV